MAKRFPLRRLLLPVGLFMMGVFTLLTTNLTATATSYTFTPVADSYVNANAPTTNYGSNSLIWMDATPETNGYLRFDVQNLDGPVSSATLRVLMGSTNSTGFDVHQVADTSWIETGTGEIIYNNAPTIGSVINSSGAVTTNVWAEIDVTSYITGNGLYSFGTTTSSNNPMRFRTKDSATPPELVIETGSGATDTPTATATATATATSTPTSTPTPTDGPSPTPSSTGTSTATATATNTATSSPTSTPTTPAGGGSTFTFNPVADAAVLSNRADNNYGGSLTLTADSSPIINSYLRFDVQGLDGSVVTATLRLYSSSTSSVGLDALEVSDNSWGEMTITYNNAPTMGNVINASGAITASSWAEIDVSSYITGEGLVSFAVTTTDPSVRISLSSKEGANDPELIVGTGSGATPTPTATATVTPTETPTTPPGGTRNWQQVTTTNAPSVVGEYAMAYDGDLDVVVLYGGNATGWPYENSTWEFNGTNWAEATPSSQPNAVYGMSMVYDDDNNVMLLFGGSDDSDEALAETWTFNAATDTWTQVTPTTSPPARTYAQMVYTGSDTTTEIYLFGGNDGTTYFNDVWRFDGSDWTQVTTGGTSPTVRTHHALAYDSTNDMILLFGGRDATGTLLADTWELNLSNDTWSQDTSSGPTARMAHGLTYDPTNDNFVLVSGASNDGDSILNDTWHYDSTSGWTAISPTQAAPSAAYLWLVYDSTNDQIILFTNGETWRYQ